MRSHISIIYVGRQIELGAFDSSTGGANKAICALSPSSKACYIAYPRPTNSSTSPFSLYSHTPPSVNAPPGASLDVILFGATKLEAVDVIESRKALLAIIALNSEGSPSATGSVKGTIIRATDSDAGGPPTGSLASSPPNQAGAAGGGFDHYVESKRSSSRMFGSIVRHSSQHNGRTIAGAAGGYLPHAVTEMLEPARDFAFSKLLNAGLKSVVALSSTSPQTMVVTNDGYFVHNVDTDRGGECMLTKPHSPVSLPSLNLLDINLASHFSCRNLFAGFK